METTKARNKRGSLVLVIALISSVILLFVFFALNYAGVFGTHKEAQTAIDAAALCAAKKISTVTVPSKLGYIGLTDMSPQDPNNPYLDAKLNGPTNEAPVIGINTAIATARLDYLIADDLHNEDMKKLVKRDLIELQRVAKVLNTQIHDKITSINDEVRAVYEQNNRRMGGPGKLKPESFKIIVGHLQPGAGTSNVPTPTPADEAAKNNNSAGLYSPYTDIKLGDTSFAFAAVASEPRLVDNAKFIPDKGQDIVPGFGALPSSVVRVMADNEVVSIGPNGKDKHAVNSLHNEAAAQAGGMLLHTRSTVYTIGIAGAFPSKRLFPALSVESLLNFRDWEKIESVRQSHTWLVNKSDSQGFPAAGGSLAASQFPGGAAREAPHTALAYGIYDWLRSLRLRPNRESVVKALQDDLRKITSEKTFKLGNKTDARQDADSESKANPEETASAETSDDENQYAGPAGGPLVGCVGRLLEPGQADPRFQALLDNDELGKQIYRFAFDYRPLDDPEGMQCSQSVGGMLVDPITGSAKTAAGNDIVELCQLVEGMMATNRAGLTARLGGKWAYSHGILALLPLEGKDKVTEFINSLATFRMLGVVQGYPPVPSIQTKIGTARAALAALIAEESRTPPPPINIYPFQVALAKALQELQVSWQGYAKQALVKYSPLCDDPRFGRPTPAETLRRFLQEPIDPQNPGNAQSIATTYLDPLTDLATEEIGRAERIAIRGLGCIRNGRTAMKKSYRFFRLCRIFTQNGVRRLDTAGKPEDKLFPKSPAFAVNILSVSGQPNKTTSSSASPFDVALETAPRVCFIMPNNGNPNYPQSSIIRTHDKAGAHFFNVAEPNSTDIDKFIKTIEQVKSAGFAKVNPLAKYPQDYFSGYFVDDKDRLDTGNEHCPLGFQVVPAEVDSIAKPVLDRFQSVVDPATLSPKVREGLFPPGSNHTASEKARMFRYAWDTRGPQRGVAFGRKYKVGLSVMRPYSEGFAYANSGSPLRELDGSLDLIDEVNPLLSTEQLHQQAMDQLSKLMEGQGKFNHDAPDAASTDPKSASPALEMIFILHCDGDVSKPGGSGAITISHVNHPRTTTPHYPFGAYDLLPHQYLYYASQVFADGLQGAGGADHPAYVYRSIMARDQFADLENGKSYKLQRPTDNWPSDFQLKIGDPTRLPPYPAGEFRLGNPFGVACCKVDPNRLLLKGRSGMDLQNIVDSGIKPLSTGAGTLPIDQVAADGVNDLLEQTDNFDICPPVVRHSDSAMYMNGPYELRAPKEIPMGL